MSEPAKPPLPMAAYLPFQALSGGSQTSKAMSESAVGLMTPCTRQNGALIAVGCGGSLPTRLEGGDTFVAPTIVAAPKVLAARSSHSEAQAALAPVTRAPRATPAANSWSPSWRRDAVNCMFHSL